MSRLNSTSSGALALAGNCMVLAVLVLILFALTGCVTDAQVVRVSKGEASALGKLMGLNADYCQITTTKGVLITEADRKAARDFCAPDEAKIIEMLRRSPEL